MGSRRHEHVDVDTILIGGRCPGDAYLFLEQSPEGFYDGVMTNALLDFFRPNERCAAVRLVVRSLRPAGKLWIGGDEAPRPKRCFLQTAWRADERCRCQMSLSKEERWLLLALDT